MKQQPSSPSSDGLQRLHTLADVAQATSLSLSTLRRAIRRQQLSVYQFGSAIRIAQADIDAWLERKRRKAR